MAKPVHSMIRVLDEHRSVDFYCRAFGLELVDRSSFEDFTLLFLRNDESTFELELTVNHGHVEPYSHGSGYGHFAVSVEDIQADHARLEKLGLDPTPVKELHSDGKLAVTFFFVQDPDGYKIEVVQRQGRYI